jgi:hypothetical protein
VPPLAAVRQVVDAVRKHPERPALRLVARVVRVPVAVVERRLRFHGPLPHCPTDQSQFNLPLPLTATFVSS